MSAGGGPKLRNAPEFTLVLSAPPVLPPLSEPPLLLLLPALPVPEAKEAVEYGPVWVACTDATEQKTRQHHTHQTATRYEHSPSGSVWLALSFVSRYAFDSGSFRHSMIGVMLYLGVCASACGRM